MKSLVAMVGGTTIVQVINVAATPALTRLFSPEDFGVLAVFLSVSAISAIALNLQYDAAVVLPKEDEDARDLVRLSLRLVVALGAASALVLGGLQQLAPGALSFLGDVPAWVPLVGLAGGLALAVERTVNYWNVRTQQFRLIASAGVVAALVSTGLKLGAGWLAGGALWLVLAYVVFYVLNIVVQVACSDGLGLHTLLRRPVQRVHAEYDDFPKYRLPQQLLNTVGREIPPLVLVWMFDPVLVGLYSLANQMVRLPGRFLSEAVRKVYYQKAADELNEGRDAFHSLAQATAYLAAVGVVPFALIALVSPTVFPWVFGEQWVVAGKYAAWMSLWMYTAFFNTPSVAMMPALRLQDRYLGFNVAALVVRVGSLYAGGVIGGADGAVIGFVLVGMLYNVIVVADVLHQTWKRHGSLADG